MSKTKFSFPVIDGPSLMQLMLAHYEPYPLGKDEKCREVYFKLSEDARKSALGGDVISVRILGTRKRFPESASCTFVGTSTDSRDGSRRRVSGEYTASIRIGKISFSEIISK